MDPKTEKSKFLLFCMNEWIQAKLNKLESENDIFAKNGLESEKN